MRAGYIIHSPEFDGGKIYTNDNLTDDVAERFMEQYPNTKKMFDLRPTDVKAANDTPKPKNRSRRKKNDK